MYKNKMAIHNTLPLILSIVAYVYSDCPHGFEHIDNSCYKVEALEYSWVEAKMLCRVLGSELATIETASEETSIEGLLNKVHGSHIDEVYWLGGADITNENDWRWFYANGISTPIGYTNWAAHRPDNVGGQENCLTMRFVTGGRSYWNDEVCRALHSFICETSYDTSEVIVG